VDEQKIAFQGELMLLNWAESSTRGRTVTFLLGEDTETHPFKDFTIRQGKRAGQRFMCVMVQVDDNEQPVEQRHTGAQRAAVLCKDPEFWNWATARQFEPVNDEGSARQFLLSHLDIKSRSEIDSNPDVAERFERIIVIPFNAHKQFFTPAL
jgi:hypothetical protein